MKRLVLAALAGIAFLTLASTGQAMEILRWQRLPLSVPLLAGQERVVFVDRSMRIGIPQGMGQTLRVQSAGGAIYLRASTALPPTRLQLQDVESGALILLDVAAELASEGQPPLEPVRIVNADTAPATRNGGAAKDADTGDKRATPVAVVLTRYAAQNLYSPLRTVEPVAGIGRVNLRGDLALDTLLPTLPVRARALAAWQLEDLWVTAVRLTNTSDRTINLDPRTLQGDLVAASLQHPDLGPKGQPSDTTVAYLLTRGRGLAGALLPKVTGADTGANLPPAAAAGERDED